MKTYIINLGLNNNPFTVQECIDYLKGGRMSPLVDFTDFVTHMGEYENKAEPTLVMKMIVNSSAGEIITARSVVQLMCTKFTQDCIAMRQEGANEGDGVLIWNDAIVDRPYEFDKKYFIDPFRREEDDVRSRIMSRLGK